MNVWKVRFSLRRGLRQLTRSLVTSEEANVMCQSSVNHAAVCGIESSGKYHDYQRDSRFILVAERKKAEASMEWQKRQLL